MSGTPQSLISFHVVPAGAGIEAAERHLRSFGIERIERSADGRRLRVVAPREQLERMLGAPLERRARPRRVGPVQREALEWQLPAVLPVHLKDVLGEILFPSAPDYYPARAKL